MATTGGAAIGGSTAATEEPSEGRRRRRRHHSRRRRGRRGRRGRGGGGGQSGSAAAAAVPLGLSLDDDGVEAAIASPEMALYCFDVLHEFLLNDFTHQTPPPPSSIISYNNDCYPLFVTWKIGKERHLRGCIGTFSPINLISGLAEYAITSATKDNRFSPITKTEFPRLYCSVSLLTKFEERSSYLDWQIGKHGLRIEFLSDMGQLQTATYLPEIPVEQDWTKIQTVDSLIKKGGHQGLITENLRQSIKLTTYQTEKVIVSYADYMKWMQRSQHSVNEASSTPAPPSAAPTRVTLSSLRTMSLVGRLPMGCVQFPRLGLHSVLHGCQTRS